MTLIRLEEGKSYRFIHNYYGGYGCGSSRPTFSKGHIIVADRTQSPDSEGDANQR